MSDRWVEYTSSRGRTQVYRVVGSYVDTIMYGVRRGQKIRCLRLEKPWAAGEWFGVVASRCREVSPPEAEPDRRLRQHRDRGIPVEQAECGPTYSRLGSEEFDGEDAYWAREGVPF